MDDKELLTFAAKAAGIFDELEWFEEPYGNCLVQSSREWNPLTDDGDALRLAVKLQIDIGFWLDHASADNCISEESQFEDYGDDPYAATRRAIVRAAAEIGKTL